MSQQGSLILCMPSEITPLPYLPLKALSGLFSYMCNSPGWVSHKDVSRPITQPCVCIQPQGCRARMGATVPLFSLSHSLSFSPSFHLNILSLSLLGTVHVQLVFWIKLTDSVCLFLFHVALIGKHTLTAIQIALILVIQPEG